MSNFNYNNLPVEQMSGVFTNFFGHVLPDFGFPDKKMWYYLKDKYPGENWDRFQTFDIYKWYESGVDAGQPPYSIDDMDSRIFTWMKSNSPYTNIKIDHWKEAFIQGINEGWVTAKLVGTEFAPAHEAKKIADVFLGITKIPEKFDAVWTKLMWTGMLAGGLAVLYYGAPVIKRLTKKKR